MVVSFPTATGKSALAECAFAYHLSTNAECKVAYICPFRSLAMEKYETWNAEPQLSKYGIVVCTGDLRVESRHFYTNRLAILTSESFDSKTRSATYREWLGLQNCIVLDEAHLLGDKSRGAAAEAALMRASQINASARLILLSATMSNALAIAKWVKSLNGKETKCVTSTWRPTVMEKKYYSVDTGDKVEKAVQIASKDSSKKTVIFVHSKITGAEITKTLKQARIRCAFHNASISSAKRAKIENAFKDELSGLNTIVSTSTLSAGVNLC